ncbi:MAG: hypothetical protein HRU09_00060 [Oligoflexales bacterium]|nr:hypothetical protein [Oligoflexales bacterium]
MMRVLGLVAMVSFFASVSYSRTLNGGAIYGGAGYQGQGVNGGAGYKVKDIGGGAGIVKGGAGYQVSVLGGAG